MRGNAHGRIQTRGGPGRRSAVSSGSPLPWNTKIKSDNKIYMQLFEKVHFARKKHFSGKK